MGLDLTAIKEVVIIEDAIYDETTHEWKNKVTNEVIEDELAVFAETVAATIDSIVLGNDRG